MRTVVVEAIDEAEKKKLTYQEVLAELLVTEYDDRDRRSSVRRVAARRASRAEVAG